MNAGSPTAELGVGLYLCHCGSNIAGRVDMAALSRWAESLPGVAVVRQAEHLCSETGQEMLVRDVRAGLFSRVVVAACSPRLHQATFRRALERAGLNPYLIEIANIREGCAWVTPDPEAALRKARAIVAGSLARARWLRPLRPRTVKVNRDVLVVGGGIAGIQAALKLAEAGHQVYLVEREASLGGNMARFDRTFPTMDCAACTLSALMAQAADHPKIRLFTLAEVTKVEGHFGAFRIEGRQRPRRVRENCTGCGDCERLCPVEVPDPHNEGLSPLKAIARPFAYAVPSTYYVAQWGEAPCHKACPAGVNVPGLLALVRAGRRDKAGELLEEKLVLPSLAASFCRAPCRAACTGQAGAVGVNVPLVEKAVALERAAQGRESRRLPRPTRRVAVVGAGPAGLAAAYRLAGYGYAITIFGRSPNPGGMLLLAEVLNPGASATLDRELDRLARSGVKIATGVAVGRDLPLGRLLRDYDAVVLAVGAWQPRTLGVPGETAAGVWFALPFLEAIREGRLDLRGQRLVVIGAGDTGRELAVLAAQRGAKAVAVLEKKDEPPAFSWPPLPLPVPVSIYWRSAVAGFKEENGAIVIRGRPELSADLVVIAAGQRPEVEHLHSQGLVVDEAGFPVVDACGRTPLPAVFAAGDVVGDCGNVPAALAAGRRVAEAVHDFLQTLPTGPWLFSGPTQPTVTSLLPPTEAPRRPRPYFAAGTAEAASPADPVLREALRCRHCNGCASCGLCAAACPVGAVDLTEPERPFSLEVGAIVLATGYQPFDPQRQPEYGYGALPGVITGFEFERLASPLGPTGGRIVTPEGREPEAVAIIHCVGSRDRRYNPYCSRVCCLAALKFAQTIRERTGATVFQLYGELRATGKGHEDFLRRVRDSGVIFLRGRPQAVHRKDNRLLLLVEDTLLGTVRELEVDMVILAAGFEPRADAAGVARIFRLQRDADGFFLEVHPKMAPVESGTPGVFLAGACQGPKDITETLAHAAAAAAETLARLAAEEQLVSPETARLLEERCSGCHLCLEVCPAEALVRLEGKVAVHQAACLGCGTCAAACPTGALDLDGNETKGLAAQVRAVLTEVVK